ncbi:MAG: hypothetical protein JWL90_990 [Chthoniobacteraceae bacterium]|nr:hypothetical protein [Chthoniobacteraceae bacterium]
MLNIGDYELKQWISNPGLRAGLQGFIQALDPAWMTLAAVNVYTAMVNGRALNEARRWSLMVFGGSLFIAWLSSTKGWPMGNIHFTSRLGGQLRSVPFAVPLLWVAVVFSSREVALRLLPRAGHNIIAAASGVLAACTAYNLEAVASRLRSWWFWLGPDPRTPGTTPILQNYGTWLVATILFAWCMREQTVAIGTRRTSWKMATVFLILNGVCLLSHLGGLLRR